MRTLEESKRWYRDAVIGALVLRGLMREEAENCIYKYGLDEKLAVAPDSQMHYDIEDVIDEMEEMGIVSFN